MTTILIEDNISWKIKLQMMLDEIGVTVLGVANNVAEAKILLKNYKPHFIVADIMLGEEKAFEAFDHYTENYTIPVIFVTQSDKEIDYKTAQKIENAFYMVKPIQKLTLKSVIEKMCGITFNKTANVTSHLLLRGKYNQTIELPFEKIIYIEQNRGYCTIHTANQKIVKKISLTNILKKLNGRFMKIHRSTCINIDYTVTFRTGLNSLKISAVELKIGKTYKKDIKTLIAKKYSLIPHICQ